MSLDRLYTLKELSQVSGYSEATLRELVNSGELAAVRRTPRGWIRVAESAWQTWTSTHSTATKPQPIVVELNPPKHAPVSKSKAVDVSEFMPKGFKAPFAWSA